MVCASLRHSIPKSIVYCQVREAKRGLLDHFFTELGKFEVRINLCCMFLGILSTFFFLYLADFLFLIN